MILLIESFFQSNCAEGPSNIVWWSLMSWWGMSCWLIQSFSSDSVVAKSAVGVGKAKAEFVKISMRKKMYRLLREVGGKGPKKSIPIMSNFFKGVSEPGCLAWRG